MSNHKSTESAIKNLEIQVGQLTKQIAESSSGGFGANIEKIPKEKCKAVMIRSRMEQRDSEEEKNSKSELARDKRKEAVPSSGREAPYPLVSSKKDKERHFVRFLDIFKKLEITIPFGESLQQMSLYSKFLKDLLTKKGKYIHSDNIVVEGNYGVVIQRILPPKYKDPRSVTIPCSIGVLSVGKLADRSITRPYGIVEDVLLKVRQFTFPADFVIMDIEEDAEIPLILGRPFMLTTNCVVDMRKGNLEMSVNDQKVAFNLFDAVKHSNDQNVYSKVEKIENEIALVARAKVLQDP
ncbi:uncharacterized protein [Glycine max]|uniref:uncharacterized protein n=1 Tax=Glycine max TaxID=3847 RepID=UPI0003DEAFC9|nr:uncharacterized protein LOC100808869 [Glycine max]|eukprot:XP_006574272.1 uncharacterized protein LOC100808869 [Glycine max]